MKNILLAIGIISMAVFYSCRRDVIEMPQPESPAMAFSDDAFYEKTNPNAAYTTVNKDGKYTFVLQVSKAVNDEETITLSDASSLKGIVDKYNAFKSAKDYLILPAENYTTSDIVIAKGKTSGEMNVDILGLENLQQGNYILPLKVDVDSRAVMHLIFVRKDIDYVALSATDKKPMPPGTYSCPDRKEPMKMVAYVETNDYDIRNMGQFLLKESKKPVFDIVVLFAANMNYDAKQGKRILFFNDKLEPILKDPQKYIKPLTDKGIKVLIDILPNHQGVGYENFQNYEEALEFAKQCKYYADKLGIDGYDIDEEYANYGALPSKPVVGLKSYFWFMKAMKEVMPDKLLTLYDYAHPIGPTSVDENGKTASDYLDYSWANYRENHGSYAGLPNSRYGKLSTEANRGLSYMQRYADANLTGCYGLYMFFNIRGTDIRRNNNTYAASQLSIMTKLFYGEPCEFVGNYHYGPKGD